MSERDINLHKLLIKPLYLGLLINIFVPVIILAIAYYIDQSGGRSSTIAPETLNILFWVLAAVSVADGVAAIIIKQKLFFAPMIQSKESFEENLLSRVTSASIVCYALTTAIAVNGFVLYMVGGVFNHLLLFAFISFIAFQIVRPRYKFMEKVVAMQEKYVAEGTYYQKSS